MAKLSILFWQYVLLIFHFYTVVNSTDSNDTTVKNNLYPFIRIYKNGTVERLVGTKTVPASVDPITGVQSKDIVISSATNVTARLYLPKDPKPRRKFPVLVYYHGGAFFTESAADPAYQKYFNALVAKANIVVVSVNYRRAPENPLPTAYDDSWAALKWVFSHRRGNGTEPWLNSHAHFRNVYVGGDSAGGNIAHNMVMRVGLEKRHRLPLGGLLLTCPHFWGAKLMGKELDSANSVLSNLMGKIWLQAYPNSTGLDDPLLNPALNPNLPKLGCKRVLVVVAEIDILRDRGLYYTEKLKSSGWKGDVKVTEYKGEEHAFNVRFPDSPNGITVLNDFASFLNHGRMKGSKEIK